MGTGSIRDSEKKPTGLRFVQWIHHDSREAARADPRPESTRAVYLLARAAETFETGKPDVQAETATFLKATESHSSWHPPCLAEHYNGKVRRLRSVLTTQSCLSQGEQNQLNQLLSQTHPLHGSGLLFGCAANKARLYHFEALHKIHFYDAWRSEPVLNREDSSLLLPPAPGMLQQGCYWRPAAGTSAEEQSPAADTPASQQHISNQRVPSLSLYCD